MGFVFRYPTKTNGGDGQNLGAKRSMGKKSGSWKRREIRKVRKLGKRKTLKVQVFNRGCRSDRREKFYFNQKSRAALEKISPCGRNDKAPIGLPVFHASFMPVNLVRLCCFSLEGEAFFQQKRYFALKKIPLIVEVTALSVFSDFSDFPTSGLLSD
ncbi:hypothetical protein [uncultured Mucilaginibacter sp.]|uniref:hypothetical protein n=1 Tax=uncultured Mucilaginibacter sp. TaxID=797541 RepID=UPI00260D5E12|nr:hypothetical protein [uncultured Mucilaginibacter sp.]